MADACKRAREDWMMAAGLAMAPIFERAGAKLPEKWRVTMSLCPGRRAVGVCISPSASADGTWEILIRLDQAEALEVIAILVHELVHASVGLECKHRGPFKRVATAIGLQGPMTSTTPGPAFVAAVRPVLDRLGPFPHAALSLARRETSGPKKQTCRQVKMTCGSCGYVARTTRKWLDEVGPVHCPTHGEMDVDGAGAPGEDEDEAA